MPRDWIYEVGPARPAEGSNPAAGPIYGNVLAKGGMPTIEATTLFEMFERSVKLYGDKPCLGRRPVKEDGSVGDFEFITYGAAHEKIASIASGLRALGVEAGARVGVYGTNSPEWMMALQACNRMTYECVPLYDTLGEDAVTFIIKHSGSVAVFTSSEKLPSLVKSLPAVTGILKHVIYWGRENAIAVQAAKEAGYTVWSLDDLAAKGASAPSDPIPPSPESTCTIMYTSGTTGDPKGVVLTHKAVIATVVSLTNYCSQNQKPFLPGEKYLSYLPLAHIYERTAEEMWIYYGGAIGYWQGDVNKLVEDVAALKPVMFCGVPRVYDRIYGRVVAGIGAAGFIKKFLFNYGFSVKLHRLQGGARFDQASPFFDKLVFSKVKARLGGQVRTIISGGAPLAQHVEEFLKVAMCAVVGQGYGLTETCAASVMAALDDPGCTGTVGYPTACTEIRLESVPDMDYDALDPVAPKGEVLIRSPQLFSGYYKDPEKTAEAMSEDGWFHTGDIGTFTANGSLKIIDRKKNIFKLAQGEYVAAEKLEATYKKSQLVEQIFVYGSSFKASLLALVVPAKDPLVAWAGGAGLQTADFAALCNDSKAQKYVLDALVTVGKADKLKGFEIIKAVHLVPEQWTVENDMMTPSFKLKRAPLQRKYQAVIDKIYENIE